MNNTFICLILLTGFILSSCQTLPDKADLQKRETSHTEQLLKVISSINSNRPDSFSSFLSVSYYQNGRRMKVSGELNYQNNPFRLRLKLTDPIFKFIVTDILYENKVLKMFVPTDNAVYLIEENQDIQIVAGINPLFISSAALGKIPMITNPLSAKSYSDKETEILELKNDHQEQLVYFQKNIPVKTIMKEFDGKKQTEISYSDSFISNGYLLFNTIKADSDPEGYFFEVYYKEKHINSNFDQSKLLFNIPKSVKTFNKR